MTLVDLVQRLRPAPVQSFLLSVLGANRRRIMASDELQFYIDPSSNLGRSLIQGTHETKLTELLRQYLQPGWFFLDLGANEGYFSVFASKLVGSTGRVLAVEPQSRLGPVILKNLTLNQCMNCTLIQCVVGGHSGEAAINISPAINTGSTSVFQVQKYPVKQEVVPCYTLDDLLSRTGIPRIDFAKIDIEGAEYEVLSGAKNLLATGRIARMALEYHPKQLTMQGQSAEAVHQIITSCGYIKERDDPPFYVYR